MLMEEVTCLHAKQAHAEKQEVSDKSNRNDIADLLSSYQQKISTLNDEIYSLKSDVDDRDREISQLRIQYKILKQRSQSVDRNGCSSADNDGTGSSRSKRGVSVDGGGNLREQLDASFDEIRLLKNKLLRLEDELNTSALEKETLAMKLDQQTKQGFDNAITKDLQVFTGKIGTYGASPTSISTRRLRFLSRCSDHCGQGEQSRRKDRHRSSASTARVAME